MQLLNTPIKNFAYEYISKAFERIFRTFEHIFKAFE